MIKHLHYVTCGILLLGVASVHSVLGQEATSTNTPVQIYFTLTGKGDSPPDPSQSQFSALIDKQPAKVSSLRSADGDKLLFALLVDTNGNGAAAGGEIKAAALRIFQELQDSGSQGHLVVFNTQIAMSKQAVSISEVQRKLDSVQFNGGSALFDAIGETCTKILSRRENPEFPRRAIILISDGYDYRTGNLIQQSQIDATKADEIAEREGVAIFSLTTEVSIREKGEWAVPAEISMGARFLQEASQFTGGQAFYETEVAKGVAPLLKAIHRQWILSLAPAQVPDQRMHSLTIKNSNKGLQLAAPVKILLR